MEGGHDVPISKIISRYYKSLINCKVVSQIVDRTYIYDNSIEDHEATLIYRLANGELFKQYTKEIPEWALPIIKE
jgi:predicted ABC-type ATPase